MLSRYAKHSRIGRDTWAVFNSLVMEPVFLNEEELGFVLAESVGEEEFAELSRRGVYVDSPQRDSDALRSLTRSYEQHQGSVTTLYLLPSTKCNLRCRYCFVDNNEGSRSNESLMPLRTAIIALDKFYEYSVAHGSTKRDVIFYGGEPLMNPETILGVVRHATELGMDCIFSVITNATLLTDDMVQALASSGVRIALSVDGPQSIHDANRVDATGAGTYGRVSEAITRLRLAGIGFSFSITISEAMVEHQDEMLDWIKSTAAKSINFNLLHFEAGAEEVRWSAYYRDASEFLIRSFEELKELGFSESRIRRKIDSFVKKSFRYCDCAAASASQLTVKPNGDVCVCHAFAKNDLDDLGEYSDRFDSGAACKPKGRQVAHDVDHIQPCLPGL